MPDDELSVDEALFGTPPESEPKRRRGRPPKDPVDKGTPDNTPPKKTPTAKAKEIEDLTKSLVSEVNETLTDFLASRGVDPKTIWRNPDKRTVTVDPNYTDEIQRFLLKPQTAKAFAKLLVRIKDKQSEKFEKIAESPFGLVGAGAWALINASTWLKNTAGLLMTLKQANAGPPETVETNATETPLS